jgi:hypothetical protein
MKNPQCTNKRGDLKNNNMATSKRYYKVDQKIETYSNRCAVLLHACTTSNLFYVQQREKKNNFGRVEL